jgi:hypothetical protein
VTAQLDLFDEQQLALLAWQAKFERADWIAPYDCHAARKGEAVRGWRCPDPECGQVEVNAYILSINHGFDPENPGRQRFDGRCARLALRRCHAEAADERAARGVS